MESFKAFKFENGNFREQEENITPEEMLSISINGNPYTITMRTPGHEEELAYGILLSEKVIDKNAKNVQILTTTKNAKNYITQVNVLIPENEIQEGIEQKRNLMSVSSCGMCGKQETDLQIEVPLKDHRTLRAKSIPKLFNQMRRRQNLFEETGGCHGVAIADENENLLVVQEDIGRHNACDKAIGSLLMQNKLGDALALLVSGRISYEIVSKCHRAEIPFLLSVSAPSSLAIETAKRAGICLIAFCREERFTIYTFRERIC